MLIRPRATPLSTHRPSRRGFSFTEILFAVMILGIGFIMVVAIFPVALQQTENSQAETVGAQIAKAGVSFVSLNSNTTFVDQSNVNAAGSTIINFPILRPTFGGLDDFNLYKLCLTATPAPVTTSVPAATSYPELIGDVWSFDSIAGADVAAYVNGTKLTSGSLNLRDVLWPLMSQNMIQSADPRYAWVAFYRRNLVLSSATAPLLYSYSSSAQLIVIALKSQAKQFYDQSDLLIAPASPANRPVSIQPTLGQAVITAPGLNNLSYTITFNDPILRQRAATGAFVIISSDGRAPGTLYAGMLNGHIYRLGTQVDPNISPFTWEFAPGYGPAPSPTYDGISPQHKFNVYMVGKALDPNPPDPTNPTYTGVAQDVTAYSTFISCPTN